MANFVLAIAITAVFLVLIGSQHGAVTVKRVLPATPAAASGLAAGDRIIRADRTEITSVGDLVNYVSLRA
ncbi:PDZ domain-containing protein, partial [Streptococcus suis]